MSARVAVVALALACAFAGAVRANEPAPLPEVESVDIEYPSPEAALAGVRARAGIRERAENGWIVLVDDERSEFWSFTTDAIPGHPAVVKRKLVERDGGIHLAMDVLCGGSKADCDALVRTFIELNEQMQAEMKAKAEGG